MRRRHRLVGRKHRGQRSQSVELTDRFDPLPSCLSISQDASCACSDTFQQAVKVCLYQVRRPPLSSLPARGMCPLRMLTVGSPRRSTRAASARTSRPGLARSPMPARPADRPRPPSRLPLPPARRRRPPAPPLLLLRPPRPLPPLPRRPLPSLRRVRRRPLPPLRARRVPALRRPASATGSGSPPSAPSSAMPCSSRLRSARDGGEGGGGRGWRTWSQGSKPANDRR